MTELLNLSNMYYVYVLWSERDKKFYIGYTNDISRRINEHYQGKVHSTLRMHKPKLIFSEGFVSIIDARRREKYFKTTKGKKALKLILRESLKR